MEPPSFETLDRSITSTFHRFAHALAAVSEPGQLVSDPAFYDLRAILEVQNSVPLDRHAETPRRKCLLAPARPGVLFRYFRTIGYDYTHPEIGPLEQLGVCVTELRCSERPLDRKPAAYTMIRSTSFTIGIVSNPGRSTVPCSSYEWVDALGAPEGLDTHLVASFVACCTRPAARSRASVEFVPDPSAPVFAEMPLTTANRVVGARGCSVP